jgi:hypothetical protein
VKFDINGNQEPWHIYMWTSLSFQVTASLTIIEGCVALKWKKKKRHCIFTLYYIVYSPRSSYPCNDYRNGKNYPLYFFFPSSKRGGDSWVMKRLFGPSYGACNSDAIDDSDTEFLIFLYICGYLSFFFRWIIVNFTDKIVPYFIH